MTNNEERFCNICNKYTLFILESDLLWYCDECDSVFGSNSTWDKDELDEAIKEFESDNGDAILCSHCNNLVAIKKVLDDGICLICGEEVDEELEKRGYIYDEDKESYCKIGSQEEE